MNIANNRFMENARIVSEPNYLRTIGFRQYVDDWSCLFTHDVMIIRNYHNYIKTSTSNEYKVISPGGGGTRYVYYKK